MDCTESKDSVPATYPRKSEFDEISIAVEVRFFSPKSINCDAISMEVQVDVSYVSINPVSALLYAETPTKMTIKIGMIKPMTI